MRLFRLFISDVKLQMKSGFYGVYAIFTAVYVLVLSAIPPSTRQTVAAVMIFTDPSAMGLFFMGALILLEKGQKTNYAIAVSPVASWEYCLGKLLSLSLISCIVATVLALVGGIPNTALSILGVFLSSLLFSDCGLIAAQIAKTLNQFVLLSVPFELFICIPPALLLFDIDYPVFILHPGIAAVKVICGDLNNAIKAISVLLVWCMLVISLCIGVVKKRFLEDGGARI